VVLAVPRDAVTASLAPLTATLRTLAARQGADAVHGLAPGLLVRDPTGWTPATDLTSGAALTDLIDAAKQRWRAQPHAAAALAWKCYTYWLVLPALVGYAGSRRVPLPRAEDVLVRYSGHRPFLTIGLRRPAVAVLDGDPLARSGDPRIVVRPDRAALLADLRRTLVDEHLEPLLEAIRGRVHLGRRTLWGSLASGSAHALARAADAIPGPVQDTIDEVLAALGVADLVEVGTGPGGTSAGGTISIQRRTCCLAFTLPEPKICKGCCIR
jgi:hypothetical protein